MRLKDLRAERADLSKKLEAILDIKAEDDEADEELLKQADEFTAQLSKLDRKIDMVERIEKVAKDAAKPVEAKADGLNLMTGGVSPNQRRDRPRVEGMVQAWEEPGIAFARYVKCWAASGQNPHTADMLRKQWYPDDARVDFQAALLQNTGTAGGFLVPEEQSRELVEYLRHVAKVRPVARIVPISGTLTMPVQTGGVAATYLGEMVDDNAQDLTFGQRRLVAHKLRALVVASNDLIRNSSPEADTIIRDDLVRGLAEAEDLAFLRSAGTSDTPKGLRYWALAAGVNAGSATTAAGIELDLIAMAARLSASMKGQLRSPHWFMPSRSFFKLYGLRHTTDVLVFPEIRESPARLLGYPVSVTDQIPTNLSPGTVTEIYLVDAAEMIIGEEMGISIAVSDVASYKDSTSTLQSSFSQDATVLRAIAKHDFIMRRDAAVEVLTGSNVTW